MRSVFLVVSTCCSSQEEARAIARLAVTARLAACASVEPVDSYYRWEGVVHQATEYRVSLKTVEERVKALEELVRSHHSYELPAFTMVELLGGSREYLRWIEESTRPEESK